MSDYDKKKDFQECYRLAHDFWTPFVANARTYALAASGYTWSEEELKQLQKQGREPIEFNIMRRPIQFFSGYLRDNINQIIYGPRESSDEQTADDLTEVGYYVWDKGNGFPVFLSACDHMFVTGMSLCGIRMDYSRDFVHGDIAFYKRDYNTFYLDPNFERIDLSDAGFAITRDLINKESAKQLLKDQVSSKEIDELHVGYRDDKFLDYHPQFTTLARNRNLLAYDQFYRRTSRTQKYLVDLDTGFTRNISELPSDDLKRLKEGIGKLRQDREDAEVLELDVNEMPNVDIMDVERPYIELHIHLNGQPVWSGEDETGIVETYPFVPILGYFDSSIWHPAQRVQGIAATIYSNQRQFNKRHMKILDMMDTQISTGYKYLIGSLADPGDLQQAGQNKIIGVVNDPEKAPMGLDSVQQLQGGGVDQSIIAYQEVLDNLSLKVSNVTEASLGMDEKRNTLVSGRLAQVQIAQNLTANRRLFDQVEESQKIMGELVLQVIQNKYPPGKIERILGRQPTEQFYDKNFEAYDAVVKEGVRSQSQKDAYYYELVNLKRDGIVDVPQSAIVEALTMTGITDLKEAIERQEQQRAEQQAKVDAQERMALELANAQKEQAIALAQERRGRVISDIALAQERASEAEENRAQAALARAKTITEIAQMEDDRLLRVLEFVNMLERQEIADREQVKEEIHASANQINTETEGSTEHQQLQQAQEEIQTVTQGGLNDGVQV